MSFKCSRIVLWALLVVMVAGLVWAGLELSGQANKTAADAGSNAADMEIASLDTIKKASTGPAIDWKKESALKKKINQADAAYRTQLAKAQSDITSTGKVASTTRDAGMKGATTFQQACENYAAFWDKNNGKTRAKLSREAGASRIKSADMAFNDISSEKIDAYNAQQDSLRAAQQGYFADAKGDLSDKDKADIKAGMKPRMDMLMSNMSNLVQQVIGLLSQVQQAAGGGMSVGGCAKQVATSASSGENPVTGLLSPVQALLTLAKSMLSNVQGMNTDLNAF